MEVISKQNMTPLSILRVPRERKSAVHPSVLIVMTHSARPEFPLPSSNKEYERFLTQFDFSALG